MSACFGERPRLQSQPVCLPACLCPSANRLLPVPTLASAQMIWLSKTHTCLSGGRTVCLSVSVCLTACLPACLRLYACLSARLSDNFKALANDSCHSFYLLSVSSAVQRSCLSIRVERPSHESPFCVLVSVNASASAPVCWPSSSLHDTQQRAILTLFPHSPGAFIQSDRQ